MAKTILITQPNTDVLDNMAGWLRQAGYNVVLCTGPGEYRKDCMAHSFDDCPLWPGADLVIYDPWIATGYEGQDQFAVERERHPHIPVLIYGPSAVPADVADMADEGAVEVLPVVLTRDVLLDAVQRHIGLPLVTLS
ncbi:MAG: hypothetical protein JO247_06085 [Chloroflexi bacterium]|nr:hypothetical protein [Chloroflexota bacterium]